jgi:hypothetical protein
MAIIELSPAASALGASKPPFDTHFLGLKVQPCRRIGLRFAGPILRRGSASIIMAKTKKRVILQNYISNESF